MKELLAFSTKTKISVGFIVLVIVFGFGFSCCDNGTNPIPQSHPDNIGYINGVDIRVTASVYLTEEQKEDLLERLKAALNHHAVVTHENISYLKIIEITGINSDVPSRKNLPGGIIRGVVGVGSLLGWIGGALVDGWTIAYNSNTNKNHITGSACCANQWG